jgi:hypothetical protein
MTAENEEILVLKMMEWKDDDMKDKAEKTKDDNMNGKNTGSIVPYDFGIGDDDGFDLVATPSTATFRAKYMDFKLGEFLQGLEKEVVPLGTTFSAHGVTEGWARLVRGEPVQRVPREPNKPFPTRKELGDTDQSKWPIYNGKPSDPWVLQYELLMVERKTGQPVIFRAKSWSGREVVEDLCRLVTYRRRKQGHIAKPIVAIGVTTRSNTKGSYKVPTFTLVDWLGATEADPLVTPFDGGPKTGGGTAAVPELVPSQLANDLTEHLQQRSVLLGTEKSTAPKRRPQRRKPEPPPWQDDSDIDDAIHY